jgi:glycerophosphoryl diester phosphodiesterase
VNSYSEALRLELNRTQLYDTDALEPDFEKWKQFDAVSLPSQHITRKIVEFCHTNYIKVSAWFDVSHESCKKESSEVYQELIELGVDIICSDFPLKVQETI